MAMTEENIWTKLAELPGSFPDNGEKVKDLLRDYYKKVEYNSTNTKSTANEFLKDITLDKHIKLLVCSMFVYGDMLLEVSGSNEIYRGHHEVSKKLLQSQKFWDGMSKDGIKKTIVAIFSLALTGDDNSALKAIKESFEKGQATSHKDYKFIYFCVAIKSLFLTMLFKDERALVISKFPGWSEMPEDQQSKILTPLPKPILNNDECEEVIAELIPVLYPEKTAEDYYQAIEISVPKEVKGNVVDLKGKKKDPNRFLTVIDPTIMIGPPNRKKNGNPQVANVKTSSNIFLDPNDTTETLEEKLKEYIDSFDGKDDILQVLIQTLINCYSLISTPEEKKEKILSLCAHIGAYGEKVRQEKDLDIFIPISTIISYLIGLINETIENGDKETGKDYLSEAYILLHLLPDNYRKKENLKQGLKEMGLNSISKETQKTVQLINQQISHSTNQTNFFMLEGEQCPIQRQSFSSPIKQDSTPSRGLSHRKLLQSKSPQSEPPQSKSSQSERSQSESSQSEPSQSSSMLSGSRNSLFLDTDLRKRSTSTPSRVESLPSKFL